MQGLIQQIIQNELSEFIQQFELMEKKVVELERRLANMNKVGVITDISKDHRRIKVTFGENGGNETPFIKWVANSCGEDSEYRPPSIGEQVLLINVGAGDNSTTSVAIRGIPSDKYPLPSNNPDEYRRKFPDGTTLRYNHASHVLTVTVISGSAVFNVPKKITLNTPLVYCTGDVKADGDITDHTRSMDADRDIYNEHDHISPETKALTSVPQQKQ